MAAALPFARVRVRSVMRNRRRAPGPQPTSAGAGTDRVRDADGQRRHGPGAGGRVLREPWLAHGAAAVRRRRRGCLLGGGACCLVGQGRLAGRWRNGVVVAVVGQEHSLGINKRHETEKLQGNKLCQRSRALFNWGSHSEFHFQNKDVHAVGVAEPLVKLQCI